MDELDSLFTIDRCGTDERLRQVKLPKRPISHYYQRESNILYKCNYKLTKKFSTKPKLCDFPKMSNKRLHQVVTEKYEKDMKISPGKLSDALRTALGLTKYGIPMYIYRMRYLGYPPGWLRHIEERPSSLKIILDDVVIPASSTRQASDQAEGSQQAAICTAVAYRTNELIEYPGFNTMLNYDPAEDHWRELGLIPMNDAHSIDVFSRMLSAFSRSCSDVLHTSDEGSDEPAAKPKKRLL